MKAFPSISFDSLGQITTLDEGMDLRDYFAAKAMQALITTPPEVPFDENEGLVDEAYYWADLMIEARK